MLAYGLGINITYSSNSCGVEECTELKTKAIAAGKLTEAECAQPRYLEYTELEKLVDSLD